jgi:hypothetical protein
MRRNSVSSDFGRSSRGRRALRPGGPTRHHLSAFAAADGSLLAWNPTADTSTGPFTLAAGAGALYVGGEFNKINGSAQPGFAVFPGSPETCRRFACGSTGMGP